MDAVLVRRSFVAFHLTLGLGLLLGSVQTLLHALAPANRHRPSHQHLALIAAVEAIAAILFVLPGTLRPGALLLVLAIGLAFIAHAIHGEWRPDLAIYATGAWFVFVHGHGLQRRAAGPDVAV